MAPSPYKWWNPALCGASHNAGYVANAIMLREAREARLVGYLFSH